MNINTSPIELTTSVTDAVLAIECILIIAWLWRPQINDRSRARLWCWVFGVLAFSSLLGTIAHGFELSEATRKVLWKPLYLCLGILVALFLVGAVYDWRGRAVAGRLVPWAIGLGAAFFALTQLGSGAFRVFAYYEAGALICALAIYVFLAATRRLRGAAVIAAAIVLNLAAAGVELSHISATLVFPFNNNGIFHLVQMVGAVTLGLGVRLGLRCGAAPLRGEPLPKIPAQVQAAGSRFH